MAIILAEKGFVFRQAFANEFAENWFSKRSR
jgi:hypothetical protein